LILLSGVFLAVFGIRFDTASAFDVPPNVDRIEEDWELVIANPSPTEEGPQVTTTMSPVGDNNRLFFAFNLNYRANPFRAGGLQVEAYMGGATPVAQDTQRTAQCQVANETVRWTQRLTLSTNWLLYDITNASSQTWGTFGQGWNLLLACPASIPSLSAYDPDYSLAKSGVSWQGNRVSQMTLKRIRYYFNGQLVSTDDRERSINLEISN
jgi:hypothetical protein